MAGDRLVLPNGHSFAIPERIVSRHEKYGGRIHISAAELRAVEWGEGNGWDSVYAAMVNAAVSFEYCVAHLGSDWWGMQAASFVDLQMRVYLLQGEVDPVELARISLAQGKQFEMESNIQAAPTQRWSRKGFACSRSSVMLSHGDYEGQASVEFCAEKVEDLTVLFVFMHARTEHPAIEGVIESFE